MKYTNKSLLTFRQSSMSECLYVLIKLQYFAFTKTITTYDYLYFTKRHMFSMICIAFLEKHRDVHQSMNGCILVTYQLLLG